MRGIFRFPIELYLQQLLPSLVSPKIQLLEPLICAGGAGKDIWCEIPEQLIDSIAYSGVHPCFHRMPRRGEGPPA